MIPAIAAIAGILYGANVARKRGGNRLDMAQYATVYAIVFSLVGLFAYLVYFNLTT